MLNVINLKSNFLPNNPTIILKAICLTYCYLLKESDNIVNPYLNEASHKALKCWWDIFLSDNWKRKTYASHSHQVRAGRNLFDKICLRNYMNIEQVVQTFHILVFVWNKMGKGYNIGQVKGQGLLHIDWCPSKCNFNSKEDKSK